MTDLRGRSRPPVIVPGTVAAIETQQLAREFQVTAVGYDDVLHPRVVLRLH